MGYFNRMPVLRALSHADGTFEQRNEENLAAWMAQICLFQEQVEDRCSYFPSAGLSYRRTDYEDRKNPTTLYQGFINKRHDRA